MRQILTRLAILGNILFFLFMLYNAIDEGFKATPVEMVALPTLMALLLVNAWLLWRGSKKSLS